ncbi:MAG: hypothetical protein AB7K71_08500 [Polyangiaceae bacterium]
MLSFKVGSIGFIALCAACFVGCSSDDDGGGSGGSSGNGGTAGTGAQGGSGGSGGGNGGTSGGGNGGSSSTVTCGDSTCTAQSITGDFMLDFPACCAGDVCGADVSDAESVIGITGCIELNKAGDADANCPDLTVSVAGTDVALPGCCQANNKCGGLVDVTALGSSIEGVNVSGPNFGCQSPTLLGEAEGADCGG